jgi:hypothetical protein
MRNARRLYAARSQNPPLWPLGNAQILRQARSTARSGAVHLRRSPESSPCCMMLTFRHGTARSAHMPPASQLARASKHATVVRPSGTATTWMVACKVILAVQPARCAARIRAALASLAKQARFAREERQKQNKNSSPSARSSLRSMEKTTAASPSARHVRSCVAHRSLTLT